MTSAAGTRAHRLPWVAVLERRAHLFPDHRTQLLQYVTFQRSARLITEVPPAGHGSASLNCGRTGFVGLLGIAAGILTFAWPGITELSGGRIHPESCRLIF
jgi:hypothetical protein